MITLECHCPSLNTNQNEMAIDNITMSETYKTGNSTRISGRKERSRSFGLVTRR